MEAEQIKLLQSLSWPLLLLAIWTLPWKGVALWKAVKNNHKAWFIILLLINTIGVLEIIYIFIFSKKKKRQEEDVLHTTLDI